MRTSPFPPRTDCDVRLLPNVSLGGTRRNVCTRRIGIAQVHLVAADVNDAAVRMQIERLLEKICNIEAYRFDGSGTNALADPR